MERERGGREGGDREGERERDAGREGGARAKPGNQLVLNKVKLWLLLHSQLFKLGLCLGWCGLLFPL